MATTATKAITVFLTGATTWAGVNLPAAWATGFAVFTATALVFLVPNATIPEPEPEPKPWTPPTLGHIDPGAP